MVTTTRQLNTGSQRQGKCPCLVFVTNLTATQCRKDNQSNTTNGFIRVNSKYQYFKPATAVDIVGLNQICLIDNTLDCFLVLVLWAIPECSRNVTLGLFSLRVGTFFDFVFHELSVKACGCKRVLKRCFGRLQAEFFFIGKDLL